MDVLIRQHALSDQTTENTLDQSPQCRHHIDYSNIERSRRYLTSFDGSKLLFIVLSNSCVSIRFPSSPDAR